MSAEATLQLPDDQSWVDLNALRKPQHALFGEVRLHPSDKVVKFDRGGAEVSPGGVGQALALWKLLLRVTTHVGVDDRTVLGLTVFAQDVLNFVAKHEPEVVDAVEPQRHADDGLGVVKPEARPVHLRPCKRFDEYQTNTGFGKDAWCMSNLFRRQDELAQRLNGREQLRLRVRWHNLLIRDGTHPKQPRKLQRRGVCHGMRFLRRVAQFRGARDVRDVEELAEALLQHLNTLAGPDPPTAEHLAHGELGV